jgi:hypothetical protein
MRWKPGASWPITPFRWLKGHYRVKLDSTERMANEEGDSCNGAQTVMDSQPSAKESNPG